MSDEVKAARERLRQAMPQQIPWEHPVYERVDGRSPMMKFNHDCWLSAVSDLAEHLEDDDEPISAEWLASFATRQVDRFQHGRYLWVICALQFCSIVLSYSDLDGWTIGANGQAMKTITTRGDVRRLCTALGVPLEEQ